MQAALDVRNANGIRIGVQHVEGEAEDVASMVAHLRHTPGAHVVGGIPNIGIVTFVAAGLRWLRWFDTGDRHFSEFVTGSADDLTAAIEGR